MSTRAPICPACGVTALPDGPAHVLDPGWVCANDGCELAGEPVTDGGGPDH